MFFFLFLILFLTIDSLVFHKTPTPTTPLKICFPRSTFSLQNPQSLFSLTALSSLQHSQLFQALQNVSLAIHSLIFPLTLCLHLICLFDCLYFLCWLWNVIFRLKPAPSYVSEPLQPGEWLSRLHSPFQVFPELKLHLCNCHFHRDILTSP